MKLGVTLSIFLYLVYLLDLTEIQKPLELEINLPLFCLSFIFLISRTILVVFRWKILLRHNDYHFSTITLIKYSFIGIFFNLFLPTVAGGDAIRWYYLYRDGVKHHDALSSILFERLLGVYSLVLLAFGIMVLDSEIVAEHSIKMTVVILFLLGMIFHLILWSNYHWFDLIPLNKFDGPFKVLEGLIQTVKNYSRNGYVLLYGLLISIISQLVGIVSIYILSLSLGSSVSLLYFIALLPMVWLISMVPISIGGHGLREGAFVLLFTSVGMAKDMAIAISILFLLQIIAQGMLGGIVFLFQKKSLPPLKHQNENLPPL